MCSYKNYDLNCFAVTINIELVSSKTLIMVIFAVVAVVILCESVDEYGYGGCAHVCTSLLKT